jgi:hypothetical protein
MDITLGSIFALTRDVFATYVGFGPPGCSGIKKRAYCIGLYRTKLPGYLSFASPNFYYRLGAKGLSPYGTTLAGTEVFHHSGTGAGHLGAMYIVPSADTAVVALSNSNPLMDPVDFAAQLALSVLLGERTSVDLVELARMGSSVGL